VHNQSKCVSNIICAGPKYNVAYIFVSVTVASLCCICVCTSSTRRSSPNARRSWATTSWKPIRGQNTTAQTANNSQQFLPPRPPRAQKAVCVARAAATRLPVSSWGLAFLLRRPWPFLRVWCRSNTNIVIFWVNVTNYGKWLISAPIEAIVKVSYDHNTGDSI
jgi:hypothetical protein